MRVTIAGHADQPPVRAAGHRRYPRPSQGILTGEPTLGLAIIWIGPRTPDLAHRLRDWGDFVHIRHIAAAAIPGFTQISVYENTVDADPRFMHFYEIDREDPEAVFKSMTPLVAERIGGPDTDAFKDWAFTPSLRIMYVNTFLRVGERSRG